MCSSYTEQGVTQWGSRMGCAQSTAQPSSMASSPAHSLGLSTAPPPAPSAAECASNPTATAAKGSRIHKVKALHFRSAPAKMAASYPSQTTPQDAEQKQAEIPIYSLTPMCQLLSLHKQQESGKIISCLPPHIVAEPQETDDTVMLSDTWSEHLGKNRQTKKKSFQQKA